MKIIFKNLNKRFKDRIIFENLNIAFPNKGMVLLLGESGCGKSTLLNIISGLDVSYSGLVKVDNINFKTTSKEIIDSFRLNNIGFIFQDFKLFNLDTCKNNIRFILDCSSILNKNIVDRRVKSVIEYVGLNGNENKTINYMSGGEKQRVCIAREIIKSPSFLLCDEPTGSLDKKSAKEIISILKKLSKEMLVIIASHDVDLIDEADYVYKIENHDIKQIKNQVIIEKNERFHLIGGHYEKKKPSLKFSFIFSHGIKKMKEKKVRTIVTNSLLSLGLSGIGISSLLSFSMKDKINNAFSSFLDRNIVVIKNKNDNSSSFSYCYSAPKEKVDDIFKTYNEYIDYCGVSYQVNFENYFKDKNEVSIYNKNKQIVIDSLSARSIDNFIKCNLDGDNLVYPYTPINLSNDEIILGLNYADMANLCFVLQIQRNYSSLGEYLKNNNLFLTFSFKNTNWQYEDEQIVLIKGVSEAKKSVIYHSNCYWNEYMFEEKMCFPSIDNIKDGYYPWDMYKLYYLHTIKDPKDFLDMASFDYYLNDYIFERNKTNNKINVYYADKNTVNLNGFSKIKSVFPNIKNYYFTSNYGYKVFGDNFLNGFMNNFYISNNLDNLIEISDLDSKNELGELLLPSNVINGQFINNVNGGFKFSTLTPNLISGRKPKNINEIIISKGLSEKLDDIASGYLYISTIKEQYLENEILHKDFGIEKVVVVGIANEEKPYIYHDNNWPISFFRDKIGVSSFNLIPDQIIVEFETEAEMNNMLNRASKLFDSYSFISPSNTISDSVSQTMKYVNILLYIFTIISCILSFLLLGMVVYLNILENNNEIKLLKLFGLDSKNIKFMYICETIMYGLYSFVISSFQIIIFDIFLNKALGDFIGGKIGFNLNVFPIFIMLIFALMMTLIISFIVTTLIIKKSQNET